MQVYSYDTNGYYIGTCEAHPNPVRPSEFLLPANSTEMIPPETAEDEEARFVDGAWELVAKREDPSTETEPPTAEELKAQAIKTLEAQAEADIASVLLSATGQNADYTTHLMVVCKNQDIVMNVEGTNTTEQIDAAKAVLAVYRPLFDQIQAIREARDAAIAALE